MLNFNGILVGAPVRLGQILTSLPSLPKLVDYLYCTSSGAIWVPVQAESLQFRLCITAHTNNAGHRAQAVA